MPPEREKNPFEYSSTDKRYHTLSYEYTRLFGEKTARIALDAHLTCPNRDGTKAYGGCVFCSESRSGDFVMSSNLGLKEQFEAGKKLLSGKWKAKKYIAYFQSASNTYCSPKRLEAMCQQVLSFEGVVGITIATRADCVTKENAAYLSRLSKQTHLEVELGLQSAKDSTSKRINRAMSYSEFLSGYKMLKDSEINVGIHIIFSLPGETREDMLHTVRKVAALSPYSIKIHMLYISENAPIAKDYLSGQVALLSKEEYVALVCDALEIIPSRVIVSRLTGDGDRAKLLAPLWAKDKKSVLNSIDKELLARKSFQGILCKSEKKE